MNFIEIIYLIFIVQISSFLMLLLGMHIKGNNKKSFNPIEAIKENKKQREYKEEYDLRRRQKQAMIENINNYNGSSLGQKDIPTE